MGVQLINIGFGNMAAATRVIAIISPESVSYTHLRAHET